jgi:hypothetical protein
MWLVREGYVTEFIDGRLFAPPPMVEARKKEIESEDHDPENFPEVPASTDAPAAESTAPAAAPATETPAAPADPAEPAAQVSAEPVAPAEEVSPKPEKPADPTTPAPGA